MTHPFDTLPLINGAKLILTSCLGTKNTTVEDAVCTLQNAGVNSIITLMSDKELKHFDALQLASVCQHN